MTQNVSSQALERLHVLEPLTAWRPVCVPDHRCSLVPNTTSPTRHRLSRHYEPALTVFLPTPIGQAVKLVVVTAADGYAYERPDGVSVVPLFTQLSKYS